MKKKKPRKPRPMNTVVGKIWPDNFTADQAELFAQWFERVACYQQYMENK
jgi:hypothetical protein